MFCLLLIPAKTNAPARRNDDGAGVIYDSSKGPNGSMRRKPRPGVGSVTPHLCLGFIIVRSHDGRCFSILGGHDARPSQASRPFLCPRHGAPQALPSCFVQSHWRSLPVDFRVGMVSRLCYTACVHPLHRCDSSWLCLTGLGSLSCFSTCCANVNGS